jgi:hypothetical protein
METIPVATKLPYKSFDKELIFNPRLRSTKKAAKSNPAPIKPSSSAKTAKIKSVHC